MQIDHPIFVLSLGGTGGKFGAELERRLRQEICGPDGKKWIRETGLDREPHQLPSCFQFAYVDIDESDMKGLTEAPSDLKVAYGRTRHTASDLLPALDSYSLVAQYLHTRAEEQVRHFLPSAAGEPRVAPLSRGAGQLPTVGRACLFARIRQAGIQEVQRPITEAVKKLQDCKVDLDSLGGVNSRTCDVYVAFSVAGGVGNGMFYDYVHLVADAFSRTSIAVQIYPLVVLPSAFPEGKGGGRNARLNAGRGLLDLARLVDDQNMRGADPAYRPIAAQRPDEHGVTYREPHGTRYIQIKPSTLQTAYLFSNDGALTEDELRGSIASFVMSMAGVRSESSAQDGHSAGVQSTDINQGVNRQVLSLSGTGGRGMSTAFVTSLAVPRAGILDLFTARLISEAIRARSRPVPDEDNKPLRDAFLRATSVVKLGERPYRAPEQRAHLIRNARTRAERARKEIEQHTAIVRQEALAMAHGYSPREGIEAVVHHQSLAPRYADPFRVVRAILGQGGHATVPGTDTSVVEFLYRTPGPARQLDVKNTREQTTQWLDETSKNVWRSEWLAQSRAWEARLGEAGAALRGLTTALSAFKDSSDARAAQDLSTILADNGTARQFAHDIPRAADKFYQWFAERLATSLEIDPRTDAEGLLTRLLGGHGPWADLIISAVDPAIGPQQAVDQFRTRISGRVLEQANSDPALLPYLADLIAPGAQARHLPGAEAVRNALRGLVPTGALLSAAGPARAIIVYPVRSADRTGNGTSPRGQVGGSWPTRDEEVEEYLRQTIDVGAQAGLVTYDFRATFAETLTVVLTRTALGIMDIPEARQVMSLWADALRQGSVKDYLPWRQRLGYDFTWLLTTEEQRVSILQRLLIAMRNGQVDVLAGTDERPAEIAIRASAVPGSSAARLELPLRPWSGTSPWADLLHAYEESVFAGDELNRQELYAAIMEVMPLLDRLTGQPAGSSGMYKEFLRVHQDEVTALEAMLSSGNLDADHQLQVEGLLGFWSKTVPAALKKKIEGFNDRANTLELLG